MILSQVIWFFCFYSIWSGKQICRGTWKMK